MKLGLGHRYWLVFLYFFIFTFQIKAEVWPHHLENKWTEAVEEEYAKWVESELSTQWLLEIDHDFKNWPVDCAKFIYLTRLYFSFHHKLEFAIWNEKKKTILSSKTSDFDVIPDSKKRLQAFAKWILNNVNTRTLQRDTVLVPFSPIFIKPGVILAGDVQRGHSWLLKKIEPSGNSKFVFATLPPSPYLYLSLTYPGVTSTFASGHGPTLWEGGFRRFRWPEHLQKRDLHGVPYSSDEQTKIKLETYFEALIALLKVSPGNLDEAFETELEDLCMKMRIRINVVIDANQALKASTGQPMAKAQQDLFSTQKRDADILAKIKFIDLFYLNQEYSLSQMNKGRYQSLIRPLWNKNDYCWIRWAENRNEPIGYLRQKFISGKISSNPTDSLAQRWGEGTP